MEEAARTGDRSWLSHFNRNPEIHELDRLACDQGGKEGGRSAQEQGGGGGEVEALMVEDCPANRRCGARLYSACHSRPCFGPERK